MTFNYSFSDDIFGFGFPCVTASGQLRFSLFNLISNYWNISESDLYGLNGSGHPAGTGVLYDGLALDSHGNYNVRLRFTSGVEGYVLAGQRTAAPSTASTVMTTCPAWFT